MTEVSAPSWPGANTPAATVIVWWMVVRTAGRGEWGATEFLRGGVVLIDFPSYRAPLPMFAVRGLRCTTCTSAESTNYPALEERPDPRRLGHTGRFGRLPAVLAFHRCQQPGQIRPRPLACFHPAVP